MESVFRYIDGMEEGMVKVLCDLISVPAVGPDNGGKGEGEKFKLLEKLLHEWDLGEIIHLDSPDERVEGGVRPNILVRIPGLIPKPVLWLISHVDVVPEGEMDLWDSDPFVPVVKDGKVFGRGSEDNGQELVASLFAMRAMKEMGFKPKHDVILCFVSDEETGSQHGLRYVLEQGVFDKDDLVVITDAGNENGDMLEVAEKSIIWLKAHIVGKQAHASLPNKGINAHRAAALFVTKADERLHSQYSKRDDLYDVPWSSFEPTKREGGVPNVNTIPGEEVVYFDCRILPEYDLEEVRGVFETVATEVEDITGAKVVVEAVQMERAAPPTAPNAPIVRMLKSAVDAVHRNNPYPGGIGGGTVAATLRKQGMNVVVYGKIEDMAHSPNEYSIIKNLVDGAKVYALLALEE